MKLPYVLSRRVGQEFVTKPETWEEASVAKVYAEITPKLDEEDDFPFKDWVATLGHRTLRGPFASKKQQKVSQWLLEKERQQKQKWQENHWKQKPRLLPPVTHLPPELLPLELQPSPRLLGSGRPADLRAPRREHKAPVMAPMRHGLQVDKPKATAIVSAQECSQQPTPPPVSTEGTDENCPIGWGRLQDYVNGVRIGPGSLFSHPWDGPAPSGIHPLKPKRRSHDLK